VISTSPRELNVSRHFLRVRVVCVVAFATLVATPAAAQQATGPFSDLFGGSTSKDQSLDLRGSLFGAYNETVTTGKAAAALLDPRIQQSGAMGGADGSLAYQHRADNVRFHLGGGGAVYEFAVSPGLPASGNANGGLNANLGRKVVFDALGNAAYSPFYQFTPFQSMSSGINQAPLTFASPAYGLASASQRNVALDGTVSITDNYSKRSSVSADLHWREFRFLDSASNDLTTRGGHAVFNHHLTRALSMHAGYGLDQSRYALSGAEAVAYHTIDVGVDYSDDVSFARRTTLAFGTQTGAIRFGNQTHYRLDGHAMLTRAFARTWGATLGYNRQTQFVPGFGQPLLSDSANAGLSGLIAPRIQSFANVGLSRGSVGYLGGSDFTAYTGTAGASIALTRQLGFFGQYTYYSYSVPAGSTALQLIPQFSRQSISVGLKMWVPIINERSPRDTR
jgi:hypothetical protein